MFVRPAKTQVSTSSGTAHFVVVGGGGGNTTNESDPTRVEGGCVQSFTCEL